MEEFLDRDVVPQLFDCMMEVLEFAKKFSTTAGSEPVLGSKAFEELHSPEAFGVVGLEGDAVYKFYSSASGIWIPATAQYVLALAQLYQSKMAQYGFQVVARSVVETSAKAWWLLDPQIDLRTRISRFYVDLWMNIDELQKIGEYGPGGKHTAELHWKAVSQDLILLGMSVEFTTRNDLKRVGGVPKPEKTKLVHEYLQSLGISDGEKWYRYLSAVAHSASYALLRNNEIIMREGEKRAQVKGNIPKETVINVAALALDSFLGAVWNHAFLFGFDHDLVLTRRQTTKTQILSLL
jgi:hypothetical protein